MKINIYNLNGNRATYYIFSWSSCSEIEDEEFLMI